MDEARTGEVIGSGGRYRNMWQRLGGYPKAIVERIHRGQGGKRGDPSLKRGKRVEAEGEKNPHANIPFPPLSPYTPPLSPRGGFRGWQPNRWANFFAAQFNEASLNSLPGAADRSRGTNGRRVAGCGGWKG